MSQTEGRAPAPPGDELVGALVGGRYRIVARAARGGMARVYRAVQEPLDRTVAIKVLEPPPCPTAAELEDFRARFLREAATTAQLRHRNTVVLHDYGVIESTGALYMVLEWVEGRTLYQEIDERGPLEPARAAAIAAEVARALQEAHSLGIVHRDLKSSNIMLTSTQDGEQVKLLDFGIARSDGGRITRAGEVVGTPQYMSPEQVASGETVDARSDLYSLGVVLFEMLTGRPPFDEGSHVRTMMAHVQDEVPSVQSVATQPVPDALAQIVTWCLAKQPADRPPSATAVRRQLELGAQGWGTMSFSRPPVELPAPSPTSQSLAPQIRPGQLAALASALLLMGALLVACGSVGGWIGWTLLGQQVASPSPSEPMPAPGQPEPPVQASARPALHTVTLRSSPEGAAVLVGEELLGTTPLSVQVEPGSSPSWTLRLEGYRALTLDAGTVGEDRELSAELQREPPAPRRRPDIKIRR
jgi:serine/threonine protein kinase